MVAGPFGKLRVFEQDGDFFATILFNNALKLQFSHAIGKINQIPLFENTFEVFDIADGGIGGETYVGTFIVSFFRFLVRRYVLIAP